jgi:hypothetical protein
MESVMRINDMFLKVILIILAISAFILKSQYQGPYQELVVNYGSNILISFVIYLLLSLYAEINDINRFIVFIIALTIVELFEVTNGYGFIKNIYSSLDLLANFIGIMLAAFLDLSIKKLST